MQLKDGAIMVFADMLVDAFGENCKIGRIDGVKFCVLTEETSEPEIKEGIRIVGNSLNVVRKNADGMSRLKSAAFMSAMTHRVI